MPGLVPLLGLFGVVVDGFTEQWKRIACVLATVAVVLVAMPREDVREKDWIGRRDRQQIFQMAGDREILALGHRTLSWYDVNERPIRQITLTPGGDAVLERREGYYIPLETSELSGRIVIFLKGPNTGVLSLATPDSLKGCHRTELETAWFYDCAPSELSQAKQHKEAGHE